MWITGLLPTPLHSTHMDEHILFLKCIPFINCLPWFMAEFWLSPPKYSPQPLLSLPLRTGVRTPAFILLNVTIQRALLLKVTGDLLLFNISQSLPPLSLPHNLVWTVDSTTALGTDCCVLPEQKAAWRPRRTQPAYSQNNSGAASFSSTSQDAVRPSPGGWWSGERKHSRWLGWQCYFLQVRWGDRSPSHSRRVWAKLMADPPVQIECNKFIMWHDDKGW